MNSNLNATELVKLGKALRLFREQLHLSQEELADISNLHRTYIGGIERGERNPSILSLMKITTRLGITLKELFNEAGL